VDTIKVLARTSSLIAIGQPLGAKLCELVQNLNYSVLQNFLSAGTNPNERNTSFDTPLHVACRIGNIEAVQLLLKFGANASLTNRLDRTAIDEATANKYPDIVRNIEDAQRSRLGSSSKRVSESLGQTVFEREETIRAHSQIIIAKWWRGYHCRAALRDRLQHVFIAGSGGYERN
jgi:hypothetical protein